MDEEKIRKLNRINNDVKTAKHICDALKKYSGNNKYTVKIDIYYESCGYHACESTLLIDSRAILASLLIQKEELENEIKEEIKNEC